MSKRYSYLLIVLVICCMPAIAQQLPDNNYAPPPFKAKYALGQGGVVMIDEAHNNFHTSTGRYAPFARVVESDGYVIKKGRKTFTVRHLESVKILVVANAINFVNVRLWKLPTPSAFTDDEIAAVKEWVSNGGSLFLIADHMPFAGAGAALANAFGVTFINGFAINPATYKHGAPDIFQRGNGSLNTTGLEGLGNVESIATFMGQGFKLSDVPGAVSVINLDKGFSILMPDEAWKFDKSTPRISGEGLSQLGYLPYGKGRIVVSGEAAMFSAQTTRGQNAGMNTTAGADNYLLLLALMHWLDK